MEPKQKTNEILFIDFETRHPDKDFLKDKGSFNYSRNPETELLILCYRLNTWEPDRVDVWEYPTGGSIPEEIKNFRGLIVAHNWTFEFNIFFNKLCNTPKGRKDLKYFSKPENYFCTMAQALRWGVPASLENAALFLNMQQQKLKLTGDKALQAVHKVKAGKLIPLSDCPPGTWHNLIEYCKQDVLTTERLYNILPKIEGKELEIFRLDQGMNFRGFQVDLENLQKIFNAYEKYIKAAEIEAEALAGRTAGGSLVVNSPAALKDFINDKIPPKSQISNAQAETIEALLKIENLPADARRAAELRQILSPSAPKKLQAFLNHADDSGIIRQALQYYGAHTGRWAGRGVQPQNLIRDCVTEKDFPQAVKVFCSGKGSANDAGALIRPLIMARPEFNLIIRDYAQIETRVLFWLCGQVKELALLADPNGDLYRHFAANNIYNVAPESITKTQRQVGKTAILGLGYGMGKIKFRATAANNGIELTPADCETIVKIYRAKFNRVTMFWKEIERAFISPGDAVVNLGVPIRCYTCGKSRRIVLPSGREMNYFKVECKKTDEGSDISYQSARGKVHVWGGVLTENIVQAISRDILAEGLLSCSTIPGVFPILTVHDEIIFEVVSSPNGGVYIDRGSKKIDKILQTPPGWAAGLPLKVEGATGAKRYGK